MSVVRTKKDSLLSPFAKGLKIDRDESDQPSELPSKIPPGSNFYPLFTSYRLDDHKFTMPSDTVIQKSPAILLSNPIKIMFYKLQA